MRPQFPHLAADDLLRPRAIGLASGRLAALNYSANSHAPPDRHQLCRGPHARNCVAAFLPDAAEQLHSLDRTVAWMLGGFLAMFFLQRFFHFHHHDSPKGDPEDCDKELKATGHHEHEHHHEHDHAHHPHTLPVKDTQRLSDEALEENARMLEAVLVDFGVKGRITAVRPGPVVTLYEFEPAAGVKSSRVISLSDDVARSMSAVAARIAVISGRNVIGIELPNHVRETVYLREQ